MITGTAAHAEIMAAIHGAVFIGEPWGGPSFTTLMAQPGVAALLDPRGGLVVWRVVSDEAEILTIAVVPKRQGIGKALMRAVLEQARAGGVVTMHLEVAAANVAARGLYAALGFKQSGLRKKYYADGDDALTMSLGI